MKLRSVLFLLLVPACSADSSRATFAFSPTEVHATRTPVHAGCGEENFPFTNDDLFSLQPVNAAAPRGVSSIAIAFQRTVTKDVPLHPTIGAPVHGATFEGAEHASSPDEKTGVGVVVFGKPSAAPRKTLSKATVTMTDVPTKDGDATSAHVTLEFADGDILDETFTGSLVSFEGACAAGG